jgi:hypothetical protein
MPAPRRLDDSPSCRDVDLIRKTQHQVLVVRLPGPAQTIVLPNLATTCGGNRVVPRRLVQLAVKDGRDHRAASLPTARRLTDAYQSTFCEPSIAELLNRRMRSWRVRDRRPSTRIPSVAEQ